MWQGDRPVGGELKCVYFKLEVELKITAITTTIEQKLLIINKHRVHNGLPLSLVLSHMNPVHTPPILFS